MKLKHLTLFVFSITLGSVSTIAYAPFSPAQSAPSSPAADVSSENCSELADPATPDDLAQAIAQVEVERVLSAVRYFEDHPVFADLKTKQLELETCFTQLQPNDHPNLVVAAAVSAMESKITELEVQYASDQTLYTDDHPIQQLRRLEIEALRQHLTTLM